MSDPNEPSRFECEQQEREDAIAEMKQIGADEKLAVDEVEHLCDEAIVFGAIVALAKSDEFRGYLMTDVAVAAEMMEAALAVQATRFDGGGK